MNTFGVIQTTRRYELNGRVHETLTNEKVAAASVAATSSAKDSKLSVTHSDRALVFGLGEVSRLDGVHRLDVDVPAHCRVNRLRGYRSDALLELGVPGKVAPLIHAISQHAG